MSRSGISFPDEFLAGITCMHSSSSRLRASLARFCWLAVSLCVRANTGG